LAKKVSRLFLLLGALAITILLVACQPEVQIAESATDFPILSGPYLGQEPPGDAPKLFAPGVISTGMSERDVAIMPDGNEIYFCVNLGASGTILVTRQVSGRWTEPEVVSFADNNLHFEPCLSHDGQKMFFLSTRPAPGDEEAGDQDIWAVEREGGDWGEPYNLGPPVCSDAPEFFPSVTRDGTIYFTRRENGAHAIYRSRFAYGLYQEPERLPDQVNCGSTQYNAFISPDEGYIIVPVFGREDSLGGTDYYVVFRSDDDVWSEPINLGESINSAVGREWSPYVSPDGRYFFFMSSRSVFDAEDAAIPRTFGEMLRLHGEPLNGNSDIWWVSASVIERLRPEGY